MKVRIYLQIENVRYTGKRKNHMRDHVQDVIQMTAGAWVFLYDGVDDIRSIELFSIESVVYTA